MLDPEVLIVGAGPAGLAAATELVRLGVNDVLVIDRDDAPGGLPRFCAHPGFGIGYLAVPRSGPIFAQKLTRKAEASGLRILCGTTLVSLEAGPVATITGPEVGYTTLRPRAVLVATGIREANRGNRMVAGERPATGVMTTGFLQQMVARGIPFPTSMRSLLVVGTEHVSFSAIWTARHAGMKVRAMVDDKLRVSSFAAAGWLASLYGIDIHLESRLVSIKGSGDGVSGVVIERNGARQELACDGVVFTAGWIPEVAALQAAVKLIDPAIGDMATDGSGRSGLTGIFAAGNVRSPLKASGNCARQGLQVGRAIASYLDLSDVGGSSSNARG
jgi:thioredoxin reductase